MREALQRQIESTLTVRGEDGHGHTGGLRMACTVHTLDGALDLGCA